MKFTLHANRVVAFTSGHAIEFKKGVPTHVPKELWKQVQAIGAIPDEILEEDEAKAVPELSADERREKLLAAMAELADTNIREDFTGNGSPSIPALKARTGLVADAKERDALWLEYTRNLGKEE